MITCIRYIISIVLLAHTFLACMQPSQQFFMLIPKNQPDQPCGIPFEHAKQCQPIADLLSYFSDETTPVSLPDQIMENVSGKDIVNFVFYLEDIYNINQLSKDDLKKQQPFRNSITQQMENLTTPQLLNLFTIVDHMDVIDRNENNAIVDAVASRIIANLDQAGFISSVFGCLKGRGLSCKVVQKINKDLNFEKNYIEPYAKTLVDRQELDRTVPILTAMWHNVTNALTAPARWFSSAPWATKTIMKPYYLDTTTGTMITGFVQKLDKEDKIISLLITNKKKNQNITISLADKNITTIKQIEANKDESVFICRTREKVIVINTLNKENPVIDNNCRDCAFSNKSNELYFITPHNLGIVYLDNGKHYAIIEELAEDKCYVNIKSNKEGTKFIVHYHAKKEIDQDNNETNSDESELSDESEYIDEICRFKRSPDNPLEFFSRKIFKADRIENICLHPTEDIFCVQYYQSQPFSIDKPLLTACIDINAKEIKVSHKTLPSGEIFQFIPDTDILFIGTPGPKRLKSFFSYSPWQHDHFVNTKNGNTWSKEKNKTNQNHLRLLNTENAEASASYQRIALTADGMHAIEQRAEGKIMLDVCSLILSAGKDPVSLNIDKIAAATLINETIKKTIAELNTGYMPLERIEQMKKIIDDKSYQKAEERAKNKKTVLQVILGLSAVFLSLTVQSLGQDKTINPEKYINKINEKYHGYDVHKIVASCVFGTFLLLFLNQIAAQY